MTIHFTKFGQGAPLILIHGLFGTMDNLKSIGKGLAEDFTVYLIDVPGHGRSSTSAPLTLPNMADAVYQFTQEQGLARFSLLGHSLGGKVAMELSLTYPEAVHKLIVADIAPVQYGRRHDTIINTLKTVPLGSLPSRGQADKILARGIEEKGVRGFLLKSLGKDDKGDWQWQFDLNGLAENYHHLIAGNRDGQFNGQTLFIVGGQSNYVLPEHKASIVSRFPNVGSKLIHGAGHWLHAEKPTAFIKICRDFLS